MTGQQHISKSRWPVLSPLLDELLDLQPAARAARLAALRREDAALADDLQALLDRQDALEQADFLASPALAAASLLSAGQTVGAYTLERKIGQGGMGTVWLARRTDGRFEGQVAIKFLRSGLLGPGGGGSRFAREGQILARLAHPNIARLLDAGLAEPGGEPYLVLEYVDGQTITRYCEQQRLSIRQRVELFLAVLAAVAHAHNRLILHRDLKPSNILVTATGEVKLLDFGIAKLLDDGSADGEGAATELTRQLGGAYTPQYAAPEQLQGGEVTTATDVYALGVLLYLLLSEQHPTPAVTTAGTPLERMKAVVEREPKRLSEQLRGSQARELRGDLDTIAARALKKPPAERYANAAALADDLRRWLAHEPIAARPDGALYRLSKFVRRHRLGVAAGTVAGLGLSALTVLSLAQAWRADRAEKLAQQRSAQADDLLGYMLGDFADKLRPIGRLELLDSVGGKALSHLAAADAMSTPAARLQRAKALTVIGEVRVSKRELEAALEPLQAARRLLEGDPPEPALLGAWRKAQGAAAFWVGHVAYTQRQFAPARSAWEDYRRYSELWLAAAPGQFEPIVEMSYAQNNLGTVMLDSGDLPGAATQFRGSIMLKQQALRMKPQDMSLQMDLANSISWLGTSLLLAGEFAQARDVLTEGAALISAARQKETKNWDWSYREALMRGWLAQAWQGLGEVSAAKLELQNDAKILDELLRLEPKNQVWSAELIKVEAAQAHLSSGGRREADLRDLAQRSDALDANANASTALRRLPVRTQILLLQARALQSDGKLDQAQSLLTQLLKDLGAATGKRPDDLKLHLAHAQARLGLASVHAAQGSTDEARKQCGLLTDELTHLRPLLRVHYAITQAWVDAHSCLGRGSEVEQARDWLALKARPQP